MRCTRYVLSRVVLVSCLDSTLVSRLARHPFLDPTVSETMLPCVYCVLQVLVYFARLTCAYGTLCP